MPAIFLKNKCNGRQISAIGEEPTIGTQLEGGKFMKFLSYLPSILGNEDALSLDQWINTLKDFGSLVKLNSQKQQHAPVRLKRVVWRS